IEDAGGRLTALSLFLTSVAGNIGSSENPVRVGSAAPGASALELTANATANASGKGNVFVWDSAADLGGMAHGVVLRVSSAGSGTPVDNTTGIFALRSSAGGVEIAGDLSATTSVSVQAAESIVSTGNSAILAPTTILYSTDGSVGEAGAPLLLNGQTSL